jgi:CRISPR-associated protein Cas1
MIKRTLYFGNPVYLHLQQKQLVVESKEAGKESVRVPIEDIGIVIIDHQQVSVSHGLTNALIEENAAVLWCDNKHMPNGLVLPMTANHTYTEKLRFQINASMPLKKQLWRQTVQAKIRNQGKVLESIGIEATPMFRWSTKVTSGDPKNYEAQAASWYWGKLFGEESEFTRTRYGEAPNYLLNYGYAILRSVIARCLVGSGMLPAIGIFHKNKYNPFCLADDIMEPFRPYVDSKVHQIVTKWGSELPEMLNKEIKMDLLQIPVIDILIEDKKSPLMVGAQRTTSSLMQCFEGKERKIKYPDFISHED